MALGPVEAYKLAHDDFWAVVDRCGPQLTQAVAAPSAANVFAGHDVHSSCPSKWLALPGMQGTHEADLRSR